MENYKKVKVLGKGAFGKVYLVLHKQVCFHAKDSKMQTKIKIAHHIIALHSSLPGLNNCAARTLIHLDYPGACLVCLEND